jgi:hypothetical protein
VARTRTTIKRIDPWSILKFAFVANLVLLAIQLLVGAIAWAFIRRLELIESVCDLASKFGVNECTIDGGQLFDTVLVLGLLGVVIQTGIVVFLAFLANLIFDLIGGIVVTLEDEVATNGGGTDRISSSKPTRSTRSGSRSRSGRAKSGARSSLKSGLAKSGLAKSGLAKSALVRSGRSKSGSTGKIPLVPKRAAQDTKPPSEDSDTSPDGAGRGADDDPLFGDS